MSEPMKWRYARRRDCWRYFTRKGHRNLQAAKSLDNDPIFLDALEETKNLLEGGE